MAPTSARERRVLAATAALALGVPALGARYLAARTAALADHLGERAGVPATIGAIDAGLTGTVRLRDVALGTFAHADALEASVALGSLLDGTLGADEIRVEGPQLTLRIDGHGDSELARVARRLAPRPSAPPAGAAAGGHRLRRIVVSEGALHAELDNLGSLDADDVELTPGGDGVRLRTGAVRLHLAAHGVEAELAMDRAAAELTLPRLGVTRGLAVAGHGELRGPDGHRAVVRELALGRLTAGGPLEVRAQIEDGGRRRPLEATLTGGPRPSLVVRGRDVPLALGAGLVPPALALDGGHASGQVVVTRTSAGWGVGLDGELDGVRLDHRAIAPTPITVGGRLTAKLEVGLHLTEIADARLRVGAADLRLDGWLRHGAGPLAGDVTLDLAPAPCADLLASLPAGLRGPLDGMVLTGDLRGHAALKVDLAAAEGDGVGLTLDLDPSTCAVPDEPPAADVRALRAASPHRFPDGRLAPVGPGTEGWVELAALPRHVDGAFVAAEDAQFHTHHGFDLTQIARSLEIDLRDGRFVRGGSTISQQLIKNEYLTQRRSFDRKIQEAVLTWRLEARLDKRAILGRYLNVIELGPGVFGLGAAAQRWFGVPAKALSIRQAAFLAALTSEPTTMSRRIARAGGLDPESAARVATILRAMRRGDVISPDELTEAATAPLRFTPAVLAARSP